MPTLTDQDQAVAAITSWAVVYLRERYPEPMPALAQVLVQFVLEVLRSAHGDDWPAIVMTGRVERDDRRA